MNLYETVRQVAEQAAIRVLARRGAPIWAVVTQTEPLRISIEDTPGSGPDGVPTLAELADTALPYTPLSLVAGLAIGDRVKCELLDGQLVISGRVGGSAGQAGPPGPANQLTIGSVNSGPAPAASITGDPPEQALHLVLPKGDTGDSGYAVFANYTALKTAAPNPPDGTPAWTNDGIDWRWRTALGKWVVVNTPVFDSVAARNAAIPEPTIGARSLIGAGLSEQVYSGTDWVTAVESGTVNRDAKTVETWTKWADGTMICTIRSERTGVATSAYGSLYQGVWTWDYPQPFASISAVTCGGFQWSTGASWGTVRDLPGTNSAMLRGIDITARAAGVVVYIEAMAIGRWK